MSAQEEERMVETRVSGREGEAERMARYVDPVTQSREEACYIPIRDGEVFCVVHHPTSPPRAGVVICPSIYAEELKIYGTQVLAARAFASEGFAAIRFHYRGTGNSSGVLGDTTLDSMQEDVSTAIAHLEATQRIPSLVFCGGRFGGLVAALAARRYAGAPLILWEPALEGHAYFRDIFRASQMSALAGGASAMTVDQAVERIRAQGFVDTLGYPVHRALYESAAPRSLQEIADAGARPILLVQISRQRELKPAFTKLKDALTAGGSTVEVSLVEGEGAWGFVDSPMPSPHLVVEASASWITTAVVQR
jgi:exosortase A-associated hydrolase 2